MPKKEDRYTGAHLVGSATQRGENISALAIVYKRGNPIP